MDAKEITVNYTYLKKLPDFENIRVEAGVTISVMPGQDVDDLYDKAYDSMKKQIKNGLEKFGKGGL